MAGTPALWKEETENIPKVCWLSTGFQVQVERPCRENKMESEREGQLMSSKGRCTGTGAHNHTHMNRNTQQTRKKKGKEREFNIPA